MQTQSFEQPGHMHNGDADRGDADQGKEEKPCANEEVISATEDGPPKVKGNLHWHLLGADYIAPATKGSSPPCRGEHRETTHNGACCWKKIDGNKEDT